MDAVFLDASPLLKDRTLVTAPIRALLDAGSRREIRIVVPDVVVEEVVNAVSGSYRSVVKDVRRANDTLSKQSTTSTLLAQPDVDVLTAQFRADLVRALEEHNVEISDTSAVPHPSVLERDLQRRKPFDESGRGYRDTLIWEALHELSGDDEVDRIVFVSTNTKDFADEEDQSLLHPQLRDEIGDADRVLIVPDIGGVIRHFGTLRRDLGDVIAAKIDEERQELSQLVAYQVGIPMPAGVQGQGDWTMLSGLEVDEPSYAWGVATAIVPGYLDFEYTGTLETMDLEQLGPESVDFEIIEADPEQSYVVVTGGGTIEVVLLVSYDPATDKLEVISADQP